MLSAPENQTRSTKNWDTGRFPACRPCPLLDIVPLFLIPFQLPLNTRKLPCSLFEDA